VKGDEMTRIVIADADQDRQHEYRDFFFIQGIDTDVTSNALECLASIQTHQPNLLVLDTNLLWGGCDGIISVLQDKNPKLPVILTTGENRLPGKLPAIVSTLVKPFSVATLFDQIRSTLGISMTPRRYGVGRLTSAGETSAPVPISRRPLGPESGMPPVDYERN
jgi:DNA-binding NtrC family response regulator